MTEPSRRPPPPPPDCLKSYNTSAKCYPHRPRCVWKSGAVSGCIPTATPPPPAPWGGDPRRRRLASNATNTTVVKIVSPSMAQGTCLSPF